MEKRVKILSLQDSGNQVNTFWRNKSYEERMRGLEILRMHTFGIKDNGQYISSRLQRVYIITQRL